RFNIPLNEYPGRCEIFEHAWPYIERELLAPGTQDPQALLAELKAADIQVMPRMLQDSVGLLEGLNSIQPSVEYGGQIIHSMVSGQSRVVYGNVRNFGLIDNLPQGCAVELPCLVDGNGVQPTRVGTLPIHLAALMRTNVNVQELVVAAIAEQKREHVYHAAMLDPHTATVLDLEQIRAMVDELLAAHRAFLPEFLHA
ncbi:MAG: alpha-galactosidase, partial [Pseudomonadota bacterium]|nr:alpha-galactosidase [Pseudomonadota bacterium]